jgi:hypothetical protein
LSQPERGAAQAVLYMDFGKREPNVMIQSVMLVMLGFFLAGLIASLLAPTLYKRAARLTARRIEATMPITRTEIEADKDQLRASYAVKVRRLESALAKSKEKIASQLVEISRLHMAVSSIQDQAAEMERQLEERRNAATVFEQTIKKRFPELEMALSQAKSALDEQACEINDLRNRILRRDEAVETAERELTLARAELKQLRDVMERGGSEHSGRFARRASQWTLEEYRAEYDRLNVELSKLRQQLALIQDRDARETVKLKSELQQLAQQIMTAAASQADLARRAQAAPGGAGHMGGAYGSDRNSERQLAARRPGPSPQPQARPAQTWPRRGPAADPKPRRQEGPASAASVETPASPGEGAEEKPGDSGIRSLLDRLRDAPGPLAGA